MSVRSWRLRRSAASSQCRSYSGNSDFKNNSANSSNACYHCTSCNISLQCRLASCACSLGLLVEHLQPVPSYYIRLPSGISQTRTRLGHHYLTMSSTGGGWAQLRQQARSLETQVLRNSCSMCNLLRAQQRANKGCRQKHCSTHTHSMPP
jgi:hypothetical protein